MISKQKVWIDEPERKEEEVEALETNAISMALLSPSFSSPSCRLFRCRSNIISSKYHHGGEPTKEMMISPSRVSTRSVSWLSRRGCLVLIGLSSSLCTLLPLSSPCVTFAAEEAVKMGSMVDELNAYSYAYPLELPSEKLVFKWVESRKPERYSSAAPLSPDARLRIVSERLDLIDNLVISVSIGPPNSTFLTSKDKKTWTAKDVADSVLSDKSALRVTSSQRLEESSVLDAHSTDIDGEPYWYYEYLVRKSPTKIAEASKMYRHYISSTAERDGYLYTINASTLGKQWDMMGPVLERAVESFRLLPPTDSYVPPYKDPWRFW